METGIKKTFQCYESLLSFQKKNGILSVEPGTLRNVPTFLDQLTILIRTLYIYFDGTKKYKEQIKYID